MNKLTESDIETLAIELLKKHGYNYINGYNIAPESENLPDEGENVYEKLSDRRNIIVIADEAHRTQYGFNAGNRTC